MQMFQYKSHSKVKNLPTASLQRILEEDKLLDIQEKVSLVFLMCDDAVKAYCILTKNIFESREHKILPDLVGYLANIDGEILNDKFLESLILIKNFQVVKLLGFNESDIETMKAMCEGSENKLYINCVRKALLRMCESMSDHELTHFIYLIECDFIENSSYFSHRKVKPMEINLLYLIYEDYISDGTNNKKTNVVNLIKHLHKMKKHDLAKELEKVNETFSNANEESFQNIMYPDNDFVEKCFSVQIAPKCVVPTEEDRYDMDKNNMGLCIVINQRDFSEEICLKNGNVQIGTRHGTNHDRDMLNATFTGLGYEIRILENLRSDRLRQRIREIVQQDVQIIHSSFVLCILSHGKHGEVYCVDGIGIPVEEIEKMISGDQCPKLLGKPKLIFVQACQGNDFLKAQPLPIDDVGGGDYNMPECDGPTNSVVTRKTPPTADLLTFWATGPGYASFRFRHSGSVFIQTLCDHLLKHGHCEHLEDILRVVNDQLSKTHFGDDSHCAMPQVRHTITKKLYFPHCPKNRFKAAQRLYFSVLVEELINECIIKTAAIQYFVKEKRK